MFERKKKKKNIFAHLWFFTNIPRYDFFFSMGAGGWYYTEGGLDAKAAMFSLSLPLPWYSRCNAMVTSCWSPEPWLFFSFLLVTRGHRMTSPWRGSASARGSRWPGSLRRCGRKCSAGNRKNLVSLHRNYLDWNLCVSVDVLVQLGVNDDFLKRAGRSMQTKSITTHTKSGLCSCKMKKKDGC